MKTLICHSSIPIKHHLMPNKKKKRPTQLSKLEFPKLKNSLKTKMTRECLGAPTNCCADFCPQKIESHRDWGASKRNPKHMKTSKKIKMEKKINHLMPSPLFNNKTCFQTRKPQIACKTPNLLYSVLISRRVSDCFRRDGERDESFN